MKSKLKTIKDISITLEKIEEVNNKYRYQDKLTLVLDRLEGEFNQGIINQILLWKVNRYAELTDKGLTLLNKIPTSGTEKKLNKELTYLVLKELINTDGIRLAMASTILRFKNPHIYQIIDQRVYRFIYGFTLIEGLKKEKDHSKLYIDYLIKLREVCSDLNIPFEKSDRILYELDKEYNKENKLKY